MVNEIRSELINLFKDSKDLVKKFKRATYEENITTLFEQYKDTIRGIVDAYTQSKTKDLVVEEVGVVFRDYTIEELAPFSKRKRSYTMIDYNMGMVAFVFPVLLKEPSECMEAVVAKAVESWNAEFVEHKISRSTQDMIQGGFKKGFCYISTAVCSSLGKGDDCYELNLLRNYRDEYLVKDSSSGHEIVKDYYNIAPTIVKRINKDAQAGEIYNDIWNTYLKRCIELIEGKELEKCKEIYIEMVKKLKALYF